MKTKYLYYAGAAALAYYLYTKSKSATASSANNLPSPAQKQMAGALGAYTTGNPMMEALGSLGCADQRPGIKGY